MNEDQPVVLFKRGDLKVVQAADGSGKSALEKVHVLVVSEEFDPEEPSECFELEHPADCPTKVIEIESFGVGPTGSYIDYTCGVGAHVSEMGLSAYFAHRDDANANESWQVRLAPGRHQIEAWFEEIRGFDYVEYDGGLRTVDPDQPEPRVWHKGDAIPDEVAAVRDSLGRDWERDPRVKHTRWILGLSKPEAVPALRGEWDLLTNLGPVSEVLANSDLARARDELTNR